MSSGTAGLLPAAALAMLGFLSSFRSSSAGGLGSLGSSSEGPESVTELGGVCHDTNMTSSIGGCISWLQQKMTYSYVGIQ